SVPEPVDETAINEARAMIADTPSEPEVSSIVEEEPSVPEPVDETAINEARAMIDDTFRSVQNMKEDAPTEARELLETLYYNLDPYVFTKEEYQTHRNKIQTAIDEMKKLEEERVAGRKATREAGARMVKTVDGVEYAFRWCPPGEFMMGSPESEEERSNLETQHRVTLTKGFWMLETEVTQAMWESVMGNNPSSFKGAQNPVEKVGWDDCLDFCRKLSQKLGGRIKLPTEAQWEYACRAGSTGAYAGTGNLNDMGWYDSNSDYITHPVAQKKPNAWGLYDMHGNVWEWCLDSYSSNIGSARVIRGGSWNYAAKYCRSARRASNSPRNWSYVLGFRVLLEQ
ncbi:MAG: formylglycine-generating enzyme family protein, partial [Planctomycetia bacterium]|nr:formylglycine-generating enzyme family protein [Planctomycetia bacterium]